MFNICAVKKAEKIANSRDRFVELRGTGADPPFMTEKKYNQRDSLADSAYARVEQWVNSKLDNPGSIEVQTAGPINPHTYTFRDSHHRGIGMRPNRYEGERARIENAVLENTRKLPQLQYGKGPEWCEFKQNFFLRSREPEREIPLTTRTRKLLTTRGDPVYTPVPVAERRRPRTVASSPGPVHGTWKHAGTRQMRADDRSYVNKDSEYVDLPEESRYRTRQREKEMAGEFKSTVPSGRLVSWLHHLPDVSTEQPASPGKQYYKAAQAYVSMTRAGVDTDEESHFAASTLTSIHLGRSVFSSTKPRATTAPTRAPPLLALERTR